MKREEEGNMRLFNASSLFSEEAQKQVMEIIDKPEKLQEQLIDIKKELLRVYNFKAYNEPEDFTTASYIIATNHITDSDAPLIMSYYYSRMCDKTEHYPAMFVFAKENCFNGVSIPKQLLPILEMEQVFSVDRTSFSGSLAAMRAASKWYEEGPKPRHFLIFSQGTIFDINLDLAEDIESGAFWLARLIGVPVLPAFIEQAVEGEVNRMVFSEPIIIPKNCRDFDEYKKLWLDRVIGAQNQLEKLTGIPARAVVLDEEHKVRKRPSAVKN